MVRVKTLGLSRTAEDLNKVISELRGLRGEVTGARAGADGRSEWPPGITGSAPQR